ARTVPPHLHRTPLRQSRHSASADPPDKPPSALCPIAPSDLERRAGRPPHPDPPNRSILSGCEFVPADPSPRGRSERKTSGCIPALRGPLARPEPNAAPTGRKFPRDKEPTSHPCLERYTEPPGPRVRTSHELVW